MQAYMPQYLKFAKWSAVVRSGRGNESQRLCRFERTRCYVHYPKDKWLVAIVFAIVFVFAACSNAVAQNLPMPPREFRAAWVATVANIDWPSKMGLTSEQQQQELTRIVDRAAELNLNALIFQVRPACDALYDSPIEPWSPYLSGKMGVAPDPNYDPLALVVEKAHAKGIEVHAWFNPYRALHKTFDGALSDRHIRKTMPATVKEYDGYLWLDPGNPKAVAQTVNVITDVVKRYDIDGVHFDDYFYPYPIKDEAGDRVPFPDDEMFAEHGAGMQRDDWRRDNVNRLIENLYKTIKRQKPHVKFGVSPFGIWRPGHPESIQGFDAYAEIYADSKLWLHKGWVDYLTPQLYWKIGSTGQSYPKLLDWWINENKMSRQIWPGNYASRVGMEGEKSWSADEILKQIEVTRASDGAGGNVLFSMKSLFDDYAVTQGPSEVSLGSALVEGPYREPALVPQMGKSPEDRLAVYRTRPALAIAGEGKLKVSTSGTPPWKWVAWTETDGQWKVHILPVAGEATFERGAGSQVGVASVNRAGHMTDVQYLESP